MVKKYREIVNLSTTNNGEDWYFSSTVGAKYQSNYGLQMVRSGADGLVGIGTALDTSLFMSISEKSGVFETPTQLPAKYKAAGRVAVHVFRGRIYVAYRGTNDGVYLIYTEDLKEWTDLGRVGSKYAKTKVSPAMGSSVKTEDDEEDKLFIAGTGEDKYIYYTILDQDGKRDGSWTKIEGTGTQSALAMCNNDGVNLTLFHTAYNNKAFFFQEWDYEKSVWTKLKKVDAPQIQSGVSAILGFRAQVVTYKGDNNRLIVRINSEPNKTDYSAERAIAPSMLYQTGLGSLGYAKLVVSYAEEYEGDEYNAPAMLSEKNGFITEKELAEWDCKWQKEDEEPKSLIGKFFCCN